MHFYIEIGGGSFDPSVFNESLSDELKGSIKIKEEFKYNETRGGVVKTGQMCKLWKSKEFEGDFEDPIKILHDLLSRYKSSIMPVKNIPDIVIYAEFVVNYNNWESFRGFCFERETMQLIADIGAGLDMDLYCNYGYDWTPPPDIQK